MKKEYQDPLTIEEQLANLEEIGLIIEDREDAVSILNDISYYRLIKGFSVGLKHNNYRYYEGVSFNKIVQLYKFNSNFRQSMFSIIEIIEINLRCRIVNYFSIKYGNFGYMNSINFKNENYHAQFLNEISKEITRNKRSPVVRNFINNYVDDYLPFYALIELFSFGTLSKFYKNMKNEDKKEIAKSYGLSYKYLESWIESIAYVRNICAHYGRLYNAKLSKTPMLYKEHTNKQISSNRIYGVLICMHLILKDDSHWKSFVNEIEFLETKYPEVDLTTMGFIDDWKEFLL